MTSRICGLCDWYRPAVDSNPFGTCQIKVKIVKYDDTMCPPLLELTARRERDTHQKLLLKRIFVSSPLSANSQDEVAANQAKAIEHCKFISNLGFAPYAPHIICTLWLDDTIPHERDNGINIGISYLSACCANVAFLHDQGWTNGMLKERETSFQLGIPVYVYKNAHKTYDDGPYRVILQDDVYIIGEKVNIKEVFVS